MRRRRAEVRPLVADSRYNNVIAGKFINFLISVVINPLDIEITGSGVSKATIPFTAQACVLTMKMHVDAVEPTNWSEV